MAIKKVSKSNEEVQLINVENTINEILKTAILKKTPRVKSLLEESLLEIKKVDFTAEKKTSKLLEGKIYSGEEILEIIKEESGYTKWQLHNSENVNEAEIENIKKEYNVDFKEKEIFKYQIGRKTNDRSALCFVIVTALPSRFEVELHTDRVGYGMDGLVDIKEFSSNIAIESDS